VNLGQILLLILILILGLYFFRMRTILMDRLIMVVLFFSAIFFIIFPDISTVIANALGIGRGTDMIFYFFFVFSLFQFINISSDRKRIDKSMTDIVRAIAIQNAKKGNEKNE
jgi:small membrane protein